MAVPYSRLTKHTGLLPLYRIQSDHQEKPGLSNELDPMEHAPPGLPISELDVNTEVFDGVLATDRFLNKLSPWHTPWSVYKEGHTIVICFVYKCNILSCYF